MDWKGCLVADLSDVYIQIPVRIFKASVSLTDSLDWTASPTQTLWTAFYVWRVRYLQHLSWRSTYDPGVQRVCASQPVIYPSYFQVELAFAGLTYAFPNEVPSPEQGSCVRTL